MSDTVLVKKKYSKKRTVYHEPSEENPDRPVCQMNAEVIRKDLDVMHDLRVCKVCSGNVDQPDQGPKLSNKLEAMDSGAI